MSNYQYYATESKAAFLRTEMQSELGHEDREQAEIDRRDRHASFVIVVNGKTIPNIVCHGIAAANKAMATIAAKPWNAGKKVELHYV